MIEKELRIVFMGTPEFAVASLKKLTDLGYNVVGVVTAPDRPAGRGKQIRFSPVKSFALKNHIHLLQPEKLRDENFLKELKSLQPDLIIVVAFRMLPEMVWSLPGMGTFNLHASLLPDYRGAAPINWAIINGEKETGLTTFFINREIDSGHILLQRKVPIGENDNAGTLHDRLMEEGAGMIVETINRIAAGDIEPVPQEILLSKQRNLHPAPKISKEDCRIIWDYPVNRIYNFIRGLSPYPGAFTFLISESEEKLVKILDCSAIEETHESKPGTIRTDNRSFLQIAAPDGWIVVKRLQQAGKNIMNVDQFLRGFQINSVLYRFS